MRGRTLSFRFIADARVGSMRRMRSLPLEAEGSHSTDQMTLTQNAPALCEASPQRLQEGFEAFAPCCLGGRLCTLWEGRRDGGPKSNEEASVSATTERSRSSRSPCRV